MQPSITRRRLLTLAGFSAVGGALLPRVSGTEHDPTETDAWNHPLADPENTAAVSRSGIADDPRVAWERQFDQSNLFRFHGCSLVDDRLFVPAHDRLRALSTETGDTLWTIELPMDRPDRHTQLDSAARIHGDTCLLASMASIYAVSVETGRSRWRFDLDSSIDGITLLGNTAFVTARSDGRHSLVAIDATSGRERWKSDGRWVPLAATDETVVVQSYPHRPDGQRLAAFDPETGTRRWTSTEPLDTRRSLDLRDGVAVADGTVVVTDAGSLIGYDGQSGERRWERSLGEEASTYLDRIAVTGDIYVVQPDRNRVRCVSTAGESVWERELPRAEHGISAGAEHVYVARRDGVAVLEPDTGDTVATVDVADTPGHAWTPVVDDGTVYGIAGDTVFRVDENE